MKVFSPWGKKELDNGVNARLVFNLRKAIDNAYKSWDLQPGDISRAKKFCRDVKIIATGGFTPQKSIVLNLLRYRLIFMGLAAGFYLTVEQRIPKMIILQM